MRRGAHRHHLRHRQQLLLLAHLALVFLICLLQLPALLTVLLVLMMLLLMLLMLSKAMYLVPLHCYTHLPRLIHSRALLPFIAATLCRQVMVRMMDMVVGMMVGMVEPVTLSPQAMPLLMVLL